MIARRPALRTVCLGLGFLLTSAPAALAQYDTDPYDPWNAVYRPFVMPYYYSSPSLPNQARLESLAVGGGRPSGFFESLNGFDPNLFNRGGTGRIGGRGMPYYQAYQGQRTAGMTRPDGRTYVPNAGDTFLDQQAARQERFFEALRERNPKRRGEMLREIEAERLGTARAAEDRGAARSRDGRAAAAPDAAATATEPPAATNRTRPAYDLLRPLAPVTSAPDLRDRNGNSRAGRAEPPNRPTRPVDPQLDSLLNELGPGSVVPPAPEPAPR